ncbi:TetR/AcrR family transcriptional regulator [Mycolicibacterium goodii]|uniref:TetR/AcrR family transcriptional regulator n=1 Tax=Mycolicibacterium goodii TaxID=134601 RepID=UPI000C2624C4|nr:TetR/AcrR family transcriptional regulator [Mycolicibacterium goodii]PJK21362.1 TetR family transcriptional regulator [Mycolicibacterium goodii]ULN47759.1 TetR/AcrR family transcriptional regulator [Mycolicibacterium goodii]
MTADQQLQPRKRPRQRRSELTRDRILDAAVAVFAEYGYARGTTNRIAECADISIGSLYQYFPNKDAIVVALAARHLDNGITTTIQRQQQHGPGSLEHVIGDIVATAIDNHRHDPEFLRLLIEQAPRSRDLLVKVAERRDESIEAMRELFAAHPAVTVEDEDAAARLVVITIEAVVHHALAAPRTLGIDDLNRQLVAMLTRYLSV